MRRKALQIIDVHRINMVAKCFSMIDKCTRT